ncbi:MAG: GNAT family N-acetyltransferase [Myxococcaceae bacterium]|jgi:ribosomal protein S18 acetylase RimI-like enzyme|nr:GNAT family N-acetyltransferase [Myxococcaceae bacterium]MCA3011390.1 GNAT family N-acetyltransferase [Myxococcaceae bacterium]
MRTRRGAVATVEGAERFAAQVASLLAGRGEPAPAGHGLVVLERGQVLAAATYRLAAPDAELVSLVTDPNHRHRGLARRLVDEVARRARSAGCSRLRACRPRADDAALAFLRRLGFEETHVTLDLGLW